MTNQTAVHFVSQKISDGLDLPEVCEAMMDACLASTSEMVSLGCDNMTVIIVAILKGKTKAEWLSGIKSRYDALDMKLNFSINNGEGVN
jgi:protein phosphatase 2C family protein 2/3